jgi:hypothetical protein
LLWAVPAGFYLVFCWWYTDFAGPLTKTEIDGYGARLAELGFSPDRVARMRRFMEEDSGRQFLMVNIIDMAAEPRPVAGVPAGESAAALLARYMEHMWPALLSRACHPAFAGRAVFQTMDVEGISGAEHWSQAALMRYRSRRDLMDIVTNPAFAGRHEFKLAAMDKTIAFPVETQLYLSDLRVLLLVVLLALVAMTDLVLYRREATR